MEPVAPPLPDPDPAIATRTVRLADGRLLAYTEWGDPGGFPTFYFHGTPSSRLEGAFADQAAKRHGFRLIAVDRPGFGRSTFHRGRTFRDWPGDVMALADALGIEAFGAVGHSGAGPHLFACGSFCPPGRLVFLGALAPWGPLADPGIRAGLNRLDRFYSNLARRAPWLVRASFAPLGWGARHAPGLFLAMLRAIMSPADRAMLADGQLAAHLRIAEAEAFRQGSRGGACEAAMAYRSWGFDVASVRVPTHIRLGDEDAFVPREMGSYLERTIPGVDLQWVVGKGHFDLAGWDQILAACAPHRRIGG